MNEELRIESLVAEYKELMEELLSKAEIRKQKAEIAQTSVSAERLAAALAGRHDWSEAGAAAVVALAADYGSFMLRNALALALALDVEDGRLGF